MNPSPESSDAKWARLAARARADVPPQLDPSAALHAARTAAAAPPPPARTWLDDFAALFATPRRLAGCGSFAALALVVAVWLANDTWSQLEPWADLVGSALEDSL
ncbi:MAG: hypothetical protein QM691_12070 [Opitutaceae bacterium]